MAKKIKVQNPINGRISYVDESALSDSDGSTPPKAETPNTTPTSSEPKKGSPFFDEEEERELNGL